MRYFLFASLLLLSACHRRIYPDRREINLSRSYTAADFQPQFDKELYRCVVDGKFALKKFHLSGLLYLRNLPDSSTRVVFQGEMGNTFFDFGWDKQGTFTVHKIIDQMDKPALIKTLKKDFELLLAKGITPQPAGIYTFGNNAQEYYTRFNLEKGFVYYITDSERSLLRIENADEQQKVVVMDMSPAISPERLAERIFIRHLRAGFTIDLKKLTPSDNAE